MPKILLRPRVQQFRNEMIAWILRNEPATGHDPKLPEQIADDWAAVPVGMGR